MKQMSVVGGGGGVGSPASRYAFKWEYSDCVPDVRRHVCVWRGGGGGPLQVDMHLNGSIPIVCQMLGGMCVWLAGGGGVGSPASRYAFKWEYSDCVPDVQEACVCVWLGGGGGEGFPCK